MLLPPVPPCSVPRVPHIEPDRDQISELAHSGKTEPVVMLNLLRFKPDGGAESYRHYGEGVLPILDRIGAKVLWQGSADSVVIGDADGDRWDTVVLVQYPSRQVFLDMVASEEYQAIAGRRSQGLSDSRLIACTEQFRAG